MSNRTLLRIVTLSFVASASALSSVRPAFAEPSFPAVVQDTASLPCAPTCRLCHTRDEGGLAYLGPLGTRLIGLGVHDTASLARTLRCLHDRNCPNASSDIYDVDSDHDGTSDIQEIFGNSSPVLSGTEPNRCGPTYGCGARIEPRGSLDANSIAAIAFAAIAWCAVRRRRR